MYALLERNDFYIHLVVNDDVDPKTDFVEQSSVLYFCSCRK
jgi:hypothetical protein